MLDQARQAGEEWNKLSADSKKPYEEQHLKLKESYTEKKKDYDQKKKPKRALSAFLLFSADKRNQAELANLSLTEKAKRLGDLWKGLDQTTKESYTQKQKVGQEAYQNRLNAWNKTWGVPKVIFLK